MDCPSWAATKLSFEGVRSCVTPTSWTHLSRGFRGPPFYIISIFLMQRGRVAEQRDGSAAPASLDPPEQGTPRCHGRRHPACRSDVGTPRPHVRRGHSGCRVRSPRPPMRTEYLVPVIERPTIVTALRATAAKLTALLSCLPPPRPRRLSICGRVLVRRAMPARPVRREPGLRRSVSSRGKHRFSCRTLDTQSTVPSQKSV